MALMKIACAKKDLVSERIRSYLEIFWHKHCVARGLTLQQLVLFWC
jgi:hypothetical protein